jgi:hypothetical protein
MRAVPSVVSDCTGQSLSAGELSLALMIEATNLSIGSEAVGPHYHLGELSTSSSGLYHHGVSYYLL